MLPSLFFLTLRYCACTVYVCTYMLYEATVRVCPASRQSMNRAAEVSVLRLSDSVNSRIKPQASGIAPSSVCPSTIPTTVS